MFLPPFQTIVVGVDFSPYARLVVKQAQKLSQLWKAKLVLVHAIHDQIEYDLPPAPFVAFIPNIIDDKTYVERIKKTYGIKNKSVKVIAQHEKPWGLLNQVAKNHAKSLIMVGYKGHSAIEEFFFGSTAQKLVLKSKVAVWIQRGHKIIKPRRVLVPHDLSKASDRAVKITQALSSARPLKYEVFYVNEKPIPILDYKTYQNIESKRVLGAQSKIQLLLRNKPKLRLITASGDVTEKIIKRSSQFDIVLMAHHTSKSFLTRSETLALVKKVKKPMLVVR